MKVEISNGYVVLKELITHKASKAYDNALYSGLKLNGTEEAGDLKFEYIKYNQANEALTMALVESAVLVNDGQESQVEVSQNWWDNLLESDFNKIKSAALKIKDDTTAKVKNEQGK